MQEVDAALRRGSTSGIAEETDFACYDTTGFRVEFGPKNPELWLRLVVIFLCGTVFAAVMGDWTVFDLTTLICLATLALAIGIARMPDRVTRTRFLGLTLMALAVSLIYLALSLYLWMMPDLSSKLISLLIMSAGMFVVILRRPDLQVLVFWDAVIASAGVLARIAFLVTSDMPLKEVVIVSVPLLLVLGYFWFTLTMSNKMRSDLDASNARLNETAKAQAVGRLTGGIAHDFNNMLTAVLGNLELARLTQDRSEQLSLIAEAENAARQGAKLTWELLALSGRSHVIVGPLAFDEVLHAALALRSDTTGRRCAVDLRLPRVLPLVNADRGLLSNALARLLDNACDAAADGGTVTVEARASTVLGDKTLTVIVRDAGSGIEPDLVPFVFEPYFSTKPVGQGSGLGLPMAKGVIEQLGGRIELTTKAGQGTEVTVHLPAVADQRDADRK